MFFLHSPKEEDYASSMICPEPSYKSEKVHILKWRGFFPSSQAKQLLGVILRLHPEVTETTQPAWLNLTFHGFDEFRTGLLIILYYSSRRWEKNNSYVICNFQHQIFGPFLQPHPTHATSLQVKHQEEKSSEFISICAIPSSMLNE